MTNARNVNWKGPGEAPHIYTPDYQAMGDCRICGHVRDAHDADLGSLAMDQARFPVGTKVWLTFPDGAKPDRKTKVSSAPVRVPTGRIVVGVECSTSCVGVDRIRER